MPLHCGVGTRSPTCTSVELGTTSALVLLQPKPGSKFTILLGTGLGAKWLKKDVLFFLSPVVTGGTGTCHLSIDSQVL